MKAIFKIPKALSYKGDKRNWNKFKQNFAIYMNATGLVNYESENKVNIFLNIAGDEALEIYNNLKLTTNEKKDFDRVIDAFEEYVSSKQNVIYKSFKFFTRTQQPGEFFMDFYNDLKVMAEFCNFGDQKDRLIRDRIIAAIRNPDLLGSFLKAPDLSLEEVVNKCVEDELVKLNNGHCKIDTGDESVNEQESVDKESNNNYEDMLNNGENIEVEFTLDEIHVPDEILFNDMAAEEVVGETNIEEGENDVCIEENNEEEYISSVDANEGQEEDMDVKPLNIQRGNLRNRKTRIKDTQSTTSIKKEKLSVRKKKAEVIQMKIAEIKEKLTNDIKKEVGREQMGIFQKITRSRVKQFSVKNESQTENLEKQKQDEIEGETLVLSTCKDIEDEEEDPYASDDDPNYEIDSEEFSIVKEHGKVRELIINADIGIDNVDSEAVNEMVEAEYLAEQEMTNQVSHSASSTTKSTKKGTKGKKKRKNNDHKIIELKRDNLPPLILTTVKNKTLLIGKMPYPCKKCDSSFWTSMQLERHQLVHVLKKVAPSNSNAPKKVFKCEVCLKEFKKICDLERHTRVHTGEKPSVCNICNKRFQQAYNLHKHLLTHTQEKNYECVICQKRFGRSDVLNRHVLTHSIDKPYHCSICLKTFIRNSQLKLHLRKHHNMSAEEAEVAAAEKESDSTPSIGAQEEYSANSATIQTEEPVAGTSSGLTEHTQVCAF